MSVQASLIPEIEDVLLHGTAEKRSETLRRITNLFLAEAGRYSEDHVGLFDDVLGRLIDEIETKALAELSRRLAPVDNAPPGVVRRLAKNDDIEVAWPVLRRSLRLGEADLLDIARTRGQGHLLAISRRPAIGEAVTDVLVDRGDQEVIRSVAGNRSARLSETSFSALVKRAQHDGVLAEHVGRRPDISPHLFRELVMKATDVVRERLLASARPETQAEIRRVLAMISEELNAEVKPRDYGPAQRAVLALHHEGQLNENKLAEFAKAGRFEHTVAALSALCAVAVNVIDRLICGDRPDPILILCKSAGFGWPTARLLIEVRPKGQGTSAVGLEDALANFERLSRSTALRVVRFWQARPAEARQAS
jgi:uncharacterized protein (DUF2336 family)